MCAEDLPGTIYITKRHIFRTLVIVSWFALFNLRLDRLEVGVQMTLVCLVQDAEFLNSCELLR